MTWAEFYLICFAIGFTFSLLSFVLGGLHWHLPHGLGHVHFPHGHTGHVHVGTHVHAGNAGGSGAHHAGQSRGSDVSFLNPMTIAAFLAWFGGTGYLLTRYSKVWLVFGLGIALLTGLAGATIVFLFLTRVLLAKESSLDPADFEMTGVLGRISMPIREGGTGEIIYSQAGTRRTCGVRAEDGSAIDKGMEVVVTRYEKGIAYVRLWSEMSGEDTVPAVGSDENSRGEKQ